jgi:hypothetical protein
VGVSEAQVSSLRQGNAADDLFDDRERTMLAFIDEALNTPHVSKPSLTRVHAHFPARQIVELLLVLGCFEMMCRLVTTLDVEPEPSFGVDALRRAQQAGLDHSAQEASSWPTRLGVASTLSCPTTSSPSIATAVWEPIWGSTPIITFTWSSLQRRPRAACATDRRSGDTVQLETRAARNLEASSMR